MYANRHSASWRTLLLTNWRVRNQSSWSSSTTAPVPCSTQIGLPAPSEPIMRYGPSRTRSATDQSDGEANTSQIGTGRVASLKETHGPAESGNSSEPHATIVDA